MSLLEDVFLEDEAGEAQELERVIEGDEFDERPRSRSDSDENSAKEDEAEEDKRRVDPASAKPKRVIKNPRFVLNPARLTGPRGIQVVTEHFKDFKFKGKGHEREDLDLLLKKLEHWAYRLYPKFQFEDCLKKIETLGKKRAVAVHLHRIRTDQLISDEMVVQKDSSDDEGPPAPEPEEDEFDKLLQQQIDIARATPAPSSVKKTPFTERPSMMPKAASSPSINNEQRERMLNNRRMAEERRLARLKQNTSQNQVEKETVVSKSPSINSLNRSVINSSDEEEMDKNVIISNKVETIELDHEGLVVTESSKCYVPGKRHNKSKIDDSRVDKNVTTNLDSNSNNHDIVVLDNHGKVVTKSPKTYVLAKKHNKSRIDSSDDDITEPITIDVEKHDNLIISSKNIDNNKSSVLDNSDDDLAIIEPSADVEKHHSAKIHRSNIINSSDSEDEPVVMNESITIEVHSYNNKHTQESNTVTTERSNVATERSYVSTESSNVATERSYVSTESCNVATERINVTTESNEPDTNTIDSVFDSMRTNNIGMENNSNDLNNENAMSNKIGVITEVPSAISESDSEYASKTKTAEQIEGSNNQGEEIENVDELMDVDFSNDF